MANFTAKNYTNWPITTTLNTLLQKTHTNQIYKCLKNTGCHKTTTKGILHKMHTTVIKTY